VSRDDLVRRAIAAVNARDLQAYLACCTGDVELHTPLAPVTGVHEGPEGIAQFFREIEDAGPDFRIAIERVELAGDRALAFVEIHATGRASGLPVTGVTGNVYEFEGDRIKRIRIFAEREQALEAVGMRAPPPGG
jgi:ketosteroid isomerase-like protein